MRTKGVALLLALTDYAVAVSPGQAVIADGGDAENGGAESARGPGESLARNATIRFYPPMPWLEAPLPLNKCPDEISPDCPSTSLSLAADTCLSGELFLHNSVKIEEPPLCPDGQAASLDIYPRRRCAWTPDSHSDRYVADGACLYQNSYYWSLIFRCGSVSPPFPPASHQQAPLPLIGELSGLQRNGTIVPHVSATCRGGGARANPGRRISLAPGACLATPWPALHIAEAAACDNGTRAWWARFADDRCRGAVLAAERDGLVDLADEDLGTAKCHATERMLNVPGMKMPAKMGSMAFWCDSAPRDMVDEEGLPLDGQDGEEPDGEPTTDPEPEGSSKGDWGSTCHSACWHDSGRNPGVLTFHRAYPDTCINLPAGKQVMVLKAAVCPGGSTSMLAKYKDRDCLGRPVVRTILSDFVLGKCMKWLGGDTDERSYAFWCDALQKETAAGSRGGDDAQPKKGSLLGLVMVLCLIGLIAFLGVAITLLRWANLLHRVLDIFSRREGAIRL